MSESQTIDLMSQRITFVNKISIILKATSDDDSPVPGYMYKQINDISYESPGYCESLLEFLVERLDKKSYHVKFKVLKLMKYVIENGHTNFRNGLRKMSHGIHAATKFGGPPDPLHGNVPYLMVRKEAQQICEKLFSVEGTSSEESVGETDRNSNTYSIAGLGPLTVKSSAGKIEGFGNCPSSSQKSLTDSIIESIGKFTDRLTESPSDRQKVVLDALDKQHSQYCPPVILHPDPVMTDDVQIPVRKETRKHVPGRAGGGWDDVESVDDSSSNQDLATSQNSCSSESAERLESTNMQTGEWKSEEELVNSAIDDTSKQLLTRAEIATFQSQCSLLNCDKVVEFLNEKLSSNQELTIFKSLLLLENFLRCDLVGFDFLASVCKQSLVNIYTKWEGPCRAKSRKIIRILEKLTSQNILPVDESGTLNQFTTSLVSVS